MAKRAAGQARGSKPLTEKRLLAALRGQVPDRPPFWFMRQAGRYLEDYRRVRAAAGSFLDLCYSPDLAAEVTLQPVRRFHPDAAILFADILLVPHALGQPLSYVEGEGPVLTPVRSPAAIQRLDRGRLDEHLAPIYETVRRVAGGLPGDVALIGFAGAPWTVACYMVEGGASAQHAIIKRWAFADPEGFGSLIDLLVEATVTYLAGQVRAGAEALQLFDTWAGVLPAAEFERWCVQPTRAVIEGLRAAGIDCPIIGFPRGAGIGYRRFAAAGGVDAVGCDATLPLDWIRETLQPHLPVQGNLDPHLLAIGGPAMHRAAQAILEALSQGPFVFNLGHGILPDTPVEHVDDLAKLLRGWRR